MATKHLGWKFFNKSWVVGGAPGTVKTHPSPLHQHPSAPPLLLFQVTHIKNTLVLANKLAISGSDSASVNPTHSCHSFQGTGASYYRKGVQRGFASKI